MLSLYKKTKSLIPKMWKYPLWWIFKSPQREFGWSTLIQDFSAIAAFCFYSLFKFKKLKQISICVGIYNRSEIFVYGFLNSLQNVKNKNLIELSVFDCGSNDVENLELEIRKKWNGNLVFNQERIKFTRAKSFNKAVEQSSSEIIFVCDADMNIPEDIVSICNHYTSKKLVWYPIVFYVMKDMPPIISNSYGHWMQFGGKGMFASHKSEFLKVGKLNESFTEWGREDDDLWERFMKNGYKIIRNRQAGLIHNWHESFNPKYQVS